MRRAQRRGAVWVPYGAARYSADPVAEDERNIDDPARLADEARENLQKTATELRATRVPIETEPPTVFHPR
jgi:hypothetical protein